MFIKKENAIIGFKTFNYDWKYMDYQYEVGKSYHLDSMPYMCVKGFHFCPKLADVINYCIPMLGTKLAKIKVWGEVIDGDDGKSVCNNIEVVEEISWDSFADVVKAQANEEGKRKTAEGLAVRSSTAVSSSTAVRSSTAVSYSNAVSDSTAVSYSNAVSDSTAVRDSNAVSYSTAVRDSNAVRSSTAVSYSNAVSYSTAVSYSNAVSDSTAVSYSNAVSDSTAVRDSNAVSYSTAVRYSNAVDLSCGLTKCKGAFQCLFVHGKKGIANIAFKSKVSDNRFKEIHSRLKMFLNGWKPEPTNIQQFYLKCGSSWKLTPIHLAEEVSRGESWKTMPQEAIDYLAGLKEFNSSIFKKITGLSIKKAAKNKSK